jgi:glycosyltransferase involved in cell wall biosynthesis
LPQQFKKHYSLASDTALISVILPFYKPGKSLDTAIESILRQSYHHFELLLINNNADIQSAEIAASYARKDRRVCILFEKKQGIAFALNTGIADANGDLIARMDADDYSFPERLEKQYLFLKNNPETGVVSCRSVFQSSIENSRGYKLYVNWQNNIISSEEHDLNRFVESPIAHPTVMFRKSLVEKYGVYDTGVVPEDYELWLRWMDKGVKFFKIPEYLLQWNDHPARLSRTGEHYSKEAFHHIRCKYLAKWALCSIDQNKKIIVCGSSSHIRKKAQLLEANGLSIYGYTDVKINRKANFRFIPIDELKKPDEWFLVNLISKRGTGPSIRKHFSGLGFAEGRDFILAG